MLVGDSGVGKTCLLVRFKDAAFLAGSFISTVGIDFRVSLSLKGSGSTPKVRLAGTKLVAAVYDYRLTSLWFCIDLGSCGRF